MWLYRKVGFFFKYLSSFAPESCFSSEKLREFAVHKLGVTASQEGTVTETCFMTGHRICYHTHMSQVKACSSVLQ